MCANVQRGCICIWLYNSLYQVYLYCICVWTKFPKVFDEMKSDKDRIDSSTNAMHKMVKVRLGVTISPFFLDLGPSI